MSNLPNAITIIRIICAVFMMFTRPFSLLFWILYILCGLSDILDGFIARKLKLTSEFGALLDSIADDTFGIVLALMIIPILSITAWLWLSAGICVLIRGLSYIIGFKKYHKFSSLHTYLNKLTGLLLFITPVLYVSLGIFITGILLSLSAIISAVEELIIIIKSKELNRNCKSIFKL